MYNLTQDAFEKLCDRGTVIPIFREILADNETPVGVLRRFLDRPHCFLLESVEGGEKWGRNSFIGFDPRAVIRIGSAGIHIEDTLNQKSQLVEGDPVAIFRDYLKRYRPVDVPELPRFCGGAVGYFHYEMAACFDSGIKLPRKSDQNFLATFFITDTLLIFDRVRHSLKILVNAFIDGHDSRRQEYARCTRRIDEILSRLEQPVDEPRSPRTERPLLIPNMPKSRFLDIVDKAKEHIFAGDIIQAVLSQKFSAPTGLPPVSLYRALRFINPSPYLFYFRDHDLTLIGSSPETMVRMTDGEIELRPIAGTRPRGRDLREDQRLADELLKDDKERAEHVMLVDLGRNDLGRISKPGTVQINQLMRVERYSHVMHLVSHLRSQLIEGKDALDVLAATFPAGTLSGAPKIRAMEIINSLESEPRGPYGGAIGYLGFNGNMDFGIIIRTIVCENGCVSIQTGAGIVADSQPETEYAETLNKARGMARSLQLAATGLDLAAFNQEAPYDFDDR